MSTTNLYRAVMNRDFSAAKDYFADVMNEKLSQVISAEYKTVAADFAKTSQK